jgi:hypothetical protein
MRDRLVHIRERLGIELPAHDLVDRIELVRVTGAPQRDRHAALCSKAKISRSVPQIPTSIGRSSTSVPRGNRGS